MPAGRVLGCDSIESSASLHQEIVDRGHGRAL
jgi:hypothetical protein